MVTRLYIPAGYGSARRGSYQIKNRNQEPAKKRGRTLKKRGQIEKRAEIKFSFPIIQNNSQKNF